MFAEKLCTLPVPGQFNMFYIYTLNSYAQIIHTQTGLQVV